MKSDKDARYKQTKSRSGYMLDTIDICCTFWELCCAVIRNWPTCLHQKVSSNTVSEAGKEFFMVDKYILDIKFST